MSTRAKDARPTEDPGRRLAATGLVVVMAVLSVIMWVASPVAWLWVASQFVASQTPTLGGYALAFVGIVVTAVVITKALGVIDRKHLALLYPDLHDRRRNAWNRSMRDSRGVEVHDLSVLTKVMGISVGLALAGGLIWFLFFAGSSIN